MYRRWEEQVKKNVEKRGIKWMEMMEDETMGGSPGELSEELVMQEKRNEGWRMNWDVGEATEELCSFSNLSITSPTSQLILQLFRRFTYVTAHSPTLPALYLRHCSFSNPCLASPTSQFILQTFYRFSYVTGSSLTSPGEPPMSQMPPTPNSRYAIAHSPTLPLLHLRHSSFSIPSFASPTAQALHLRHPANLPWRYGY